MDTFHNNSTSNMDFFCQVEDSDWSRTLKTFAFFFVGGCGIFGNIFIIVLAVKYTARKNLHHLIINMAVADTLVALGILCAGVPRLLDQKMWADIKMISGDILCKVFTFIVSCSVNVSYISLVIISIERFRASRRTMQISQPYTMKKRMVVVACSWLVPLVVSSTETMYRTVKEHFPGGDYACQGTLQLPITLRVLTYIAFVSAACCIVALSIVTLRTISRRQQIEASLSEVQRKRREKRIACTMKMVLCSLFLYLSAYLPYVVWNSLKIMDVQNNNIFLCLELTVLDFLTNFLPLVNSCFSPGIYLMFLSDFREAARKIFRRTGRSAEGRGVHLQPSLNRQEQPPSIVNIQSRINTLNQTENQNLTAM